MGGSQHDMLCLNLRRFLLHTNLLDGHNLLGFDVHPILCGVARDAHGQYAGG